MACLSGQIMKRFAIGRADLEVRELYIQSTPLRRAKHGAYEVDGRDWKWAKP
jgi:hypothetical protein